MFAIFHVRGGPKRAPHPYSFPELAFSGVYIYLSRIAICLGISCAMYYVYVLRVVSIVSVVFVYRRGRDGRKGGRREGRWTTIIKKKIG